MALTTHRYTANLSWHGTTASGYENYDRTHSVGPLQLSSDPAFRGNPALLNPEQLLVMAACSCQLLSFLAVAARARLDVISYEDNAEAEMPEEDKPVRITRIVLKPSITIRSNVTEDRVRHLVEVAHRECYIANSLKTDVLVEPIIHLV
ncbi:MAG: OsmC family protein [Bryobacterales bacterium]|nr:OsmC family protein [Bryobacterales bacterium]